MKVVLLTLACSGCGTVEATPALCAWLALALGLALLAAHHEEQDA